MVYKLFISVVTDFVVLTIFHAFEQQGLQQHEGVEEKKNVLNGGLEPPTLGLLDLRSNRLSYRNTDI